LGNGCAGCGAARIAGGTKKRPVVQLRGVRVQDNYS
jgi:hypothetical protein